ncbi:MAG: VWA domain-containing protein [Ruminococcus sp.]|nr:VWA domain-containing protein [Ruminococcus sp.]MBP3380045.1 VWA domain-containing protein [Ruminococcus sp.]
MQLNTKGQMTYTVDLVFCIDATGSMAPILKAVKENALSFYSDLMKVLNEKNKRVESVRIKLIAFRDYIADGEEAMLVTDFFNLPEQAVEFSNTVNGITHFGGGDIPEDSLEALAYAIRSDWSQSGTKRRQIIVLWSDAPPHPLGFAKGKSDNYPSGMAANFAELTEWWENEQLGYVNRRAKRLILYAPATDIERGYDVETVYPWNNVVENWNNVVHFPSVAGKGLEEFQYEEILSAIVQSI